METSENDQSVRDRPIKFGEGYHLENITLTTLVDSTQRESDTDKSPDIDVVHVMVLGQAEERLKLETLLLESVASRRREFVFRCDIASLLAGELTGQFIDGLARQLLENLVFFQQRDEQPSRRALVFVAYDLGDLIVKKAICIAGADEEQYPGIFTGTARFIFSGCFQGARNSQLLYSKIFDYLVSQKGSPSGRALAPGSISSVAKCSIEINEAFIASKITLRSQVISLYANVDGQGTISDIFDQGTATIGVPNEIIVEEQTQKDKEPFPDLRNTVCSNIKAWLPHASWIPFQQSLLAVTSAHRPLSSTCLDDSHPVFKSAEHETWMTSAGVRILHVSGDNHNGVTEVAEQVFLDWRLKQRKNRKEGVVFLPISFVFSARDPTRRSIKDVISLLLVSYLSGIAIAKGDPLAGAIRDQLVLQHAWTETDLFKLLAIFSREFMGFNLVLLLQDIDECDKHSRDAFWAVLSAYATASETRFKVVVTCRKSLDLHDELRHWPDIPIDTWILPDNKGDSNEDAADDYEYDLISTLCPCGHGKTEVREKLEELRPMEKHNRDMILKLIGEITNWPQELSPKAFHEFSSHLGAVTLATTPADILRNALRNVADQEGLSWILKWLFMGQRPLSYHELAMMLYYYKRGEAQSFQEPSPMELEDYLSQIRLWLRGIAESVSGQVRVKEEIRDYLQNELSDVWAESTSPDAITTFLLNYLNAPNIQQRLEAMNREYQSRVQRSDDAITPPLISDGQDIIYYAIQALPYHLSENPVILKSIKDELLASDGKLATWSKAYWAMSNSFSRPESGASNSPCETLLALGNLKPEAVTILEEMQHSSLSSTNGSSREKNSSPNSSDLDSLSKAIREANEDVAVSIAEELISASKGQDQDYEHIAASKYSSKIPWPSWFLWRAVYLNMVRLVTLLVNDGMDPDPTDGGPEFFPSPLYMAARLCHDQIIDVLIEHGANLHVKRLDKYKAVQTATSNGSMHGVKVMIAKDGSLLESQEPETPLYFAALEGGWTMAKMLLDLGADPNSGLGERPNYRWAPLVVAVESNHLKTVKILLENKADPNICGPNNLDTPLWFAAIKAASPDMVRLLLEHGADPNHELLDPPLPIELIRSSVSAKDKLAIFEVLVKNSPPVRVNATDSEGMTPLLYAAEAGELSLVTWLLEHEADINATDTSSRSVLWYAVKNLRVEVVRELLNWKPQLNNLTVTGQPLVEIAIEDVGIMRMLLDAGIDMELPNYNNHTVLNIAVDWKKRDVVRLLVERKANMYHQGNGGWNAITIATWSTADPEILRILAEGGANLNDAHPDTGSTPLHFATANDVELAKVILEYRKSVDLEKRNNYGRTPLLYACGEDNADCVKLLVRAGADVNAEDQWGWTVLSLASRRALKADVTDLLLAQPDLKIDAEGSTKGTALMVSCRSLNREMVTKLLAHGADANVSVKELSYNNTAIKSACIPWKELYTEKKDEMDGIISELIANGADVNAVGGCNIYNAICAAAFGGSASTINLLLDKGASAQDPDPLGRLPIHYAAANGVKNFEAIALVHKGDILVCDRAGKNALHWAAQFGNVKTIEAILDLLDSSPNKRKEYVNQADIDGWTPLCWATRPVVERLGPDSESEPRDYVKTVKFLIEQGADLSVKFTMGTGKNAETFTPVQMARLCGTAVASEIIDMLDISLDDSSTNGTAGKGIDANKQNKRYKSNTAYCDICLNAIFGHSYQCQTCPDFDTCKKCYGRIDIFHNDVSLDDEKQHSFAFRKDYEEEFEDLPAPESPDPDNGNQEDSGGKAAELSDDDELQKNEDDETDELGLGSLDDLDELEVAEDDVLTPP